MRSGRMLSILLTACAGMLGCFVPEEFDVTLEIDKDRNYQFSYDGTLVFAPVLSQIKENGSLSVGEEASVAQGVAELRNKPGVVSALYAGRGRFRIKYREAGALTPGRTLFMDMGRFEADPGGGIRISGPAFSQADLRELTEVGLKLDGTIRLKSAVPVVEHNAASTPWFGGLFGAYKWRVTATEASLPTALVR
jgi:hypothetical protein